MCKIMDLCGSFDMLPLCAYTLTPTIDLLLAYGSLEEYVQRVCAYACAYACAQQTFEPFALPLDKPVFGGNEPWSQSPKLKPIRCDPKVYMTTARTPIAPTTPLTRMCCSVL
jgi:hypothetical protein